MKENNVAQTRLLGQDSNGVGSIQEQLIAYGDALNSLSNTAPSGSDFENHVRQVLVAREAVARTLRGAEEHYRVVTADELKKLHELDQQLKASALIITTAVGPSKLGSWRESLGIPPIAWWWSLSDLVPQEKSILATVFKYLLWILIAISLSFILEIVKRFLSGGTDLPSTVLQGLLAFLATGTVVQGARQFIEKASTKGERKSFLSQRALIGTVITLTAVALLMEWARPKVAVIYNDKGVDLYEKKQLSSAIEKYQRAISLEPKYAQAHFNMGNAYEDVLNYDKAIVEYESAIMADQEYYRPYNNIARLYIVYRNEPLKALRLIDTALTLSIDPEDDATQVKYRLYKNRGWANLTLKNYRQAKADLEQALGFVSNGADAHCLLAQVLEEQKDQSSAVQWALCKTLADQQKGDVEVHWSGLAVEKVKE
jgi:tetratricopeptide (TPR) repeat protein